MPNPSFVNHVHSQSLFFFFLLAKGIKSTVLAVTTQSNLWLERPDLEFITILIKPYRQKRGSFSSLILLS